MQSIRDLGLSKKLAMGFGLLLLVFAVQGWIVVAGLNRMGILERELKERSEQATAFTRYAGDGDASYRIIADGIINRDLEASATQWDKNRQATLGRLDSIEAFADTPREKAIAKQLRETFEQMHDAWKNQIQPGLKRASAIDASVQEMDSQMDKLVTTYKSGLWDLRDSLENEAIEARIAYHQELVRTRLLVLAGLFFSLLLGVGAWTILRSQILPPVYELTGIAMDFSNGDLHRQVHWRSGDEMGSLADSFRLMSNHLKHVLEQMQRVEKGILSNVFAPQSQRDELGGALAAMMGSMRLAVLKIQEASKGTQENARDLELAAQGISKNAQAASHEADGVERSILEVRGAISAVATAAEEMSAGVQEVARMTSRVAEVSRQTTRDASLIEGKMSQLAESSRSISKLVELVTGISEQTKLLALNATIEAARAGEAGKGFSVVAEEVKALANSSGVATKEIGLAVGSIGTSVEEAIASVKAILHSVSDMASLSISSASAVEEQNSAIQDVVRNLASGSSSLEGVTASIVRVSQNTRRASDQISALTGMAAGMSNIAGQWNQVASKFQV